MAKGETTNAGIWVERGGNGEKLLVLLHGLGANATVWNEMCPIIEESWRGRWLAPDLRGHGRSIFEGPHGYGTHAADIAQLIKDERAGTVFVVGHSLGGVVGAVLATGWFGPQLAGLFSFGVKFNWSRDEISKSHELSRKPQRVFSTKVEAIERYLKVAGLYGLVDANSEEAARGISKVEGGFGIRLDPRAFSAVGPSIPGIFSQVTAPFRLGVGQLDAMVDAEEMKRMDKDGVVFSGCGHNAHRENPSLVWKAILNELVANAAMRE